LTADDTWKRLGTQVFQVTGPVQNYETFAIRDKKVHQLGRGIGGQGVTSLCVADLNRDKRPELVYAYSWGSGIHRSHVAVLDILAPEPKEHVAPQTYFNALQDLAVERVDDQTVRVLAGKTKVGRLVLARKEGTLAAWIELNKDLDDGIKKDFRDLKPARWNEPKSADLCEAVFRYLFEHNESGAKKASAYFLSIEGQDPSAEFLERFKGHRPAVRSGLEFKQDAGGLKFWIESLKWIDDNTVEVRGGYYFGRLNAASHLYRVVRKAGKWMVESDKLEEIS
jgi:hypothetical protein